MLYTLKNDFHNTTVTVRTIGLQHIYHTTEITLTDPQIKRVRKILCGIDGCTCPQHPSGIRGPQTTTDGLKLIIKF